MQTLTQQIITRFDQVKQVGDFFFDLKSELEAIASLATPTTPPIQKKQVQFGHNFFEQVQMLREAIFSNLLLNPEFKSHKYIPVDEYDKFFDMIKNNKLPNETMIAGHICALHMSKMKYSTKIFIDYLGKCSTITTYYDINPAMQKEFATFQTNIKVDVREFYNSVVNNQAITNKVENLANRILTQPLALQCSKVELRFFVSKVPNLRGFAGRSSIYVSIDEILQLYQACLQAKRSENETSTIVRLELIRLFAHEIIHVLLRKTEKNLNESTPELILLKQQNSQSQLLPQPQFQVEESGILVELELFGAKIIFDQACQIQPFDSIYFEQLLHDVTNGIVPRLDRTKVVVVDPRAYSRMTLDMGIPEKDIIEL